MKNTVKPALERTSTTPTSTTPTSTTAPTSTLTSAIDPDPTTASSEGAAEDEAVDGAGDGKQRRRFKEVWLVEDRREGRSMWTRVGTAFENNDGSWNIRLSALPVGAGRLNMRDPLVREKPADEAAPKIEQRASDSRRDGRGGRAERRVAA